MDNTCLICGKQFESSKSLSNHIVKRHSISKKEYYDVYFRQPNEGLCKVCGKPTKFLRNAYKECCSYKCTCILRYGTESILSIPEIHSKGVEKSKTDEVRRKIKQTNIERYGVTNPMQQSYVRDKLSTNEVKQKRNSSIIKTNLDKYGVSWPAQLTETVEKQAQTNLTKYGVKSFLQTDECRQAYNNNKQKLIEIYHQNGYTTRLELIEKYGQGWLSLNIPETIDGNIAFIDNKYIGDIEAYFTRDRANRIQSDLEQEIYEYVRSIYKDTLYKNNRTVIYPLELDFFLPKLNLAIEVNGTYWHSDLYKDKYYHFNKSRLCEEKHIRLIHIYEWEWNTNQEEIKSILYNAIYEQPTYKKLDDIHFEVLFNKHGLCKSKILTIPNVIIYCDYNRGYIPDLLKRNYTEPNVWCINFNKIVNSTDNYQYKVYGAGSVVYKV